jgi:hypothetical protein
MFGNPDNVGELQTDKANVIAFDEIIDPLEFFGGIFNAHEPAFSCCCELLRVVPVGNNFATWRKGNFRIVSPFADKGETVHGWGRYNSQVTLHKKTAARVGPPRASSK